MIDVAECLADMAHVAPIDLLQPTFEERVSCAADPASCVHGLPHDLGSFEPPTSAEPAVTYRRHE